jgi:copper transport protein
MTGRWRRRLAGAFLLVLLGVLVLPAVAGWRVAAHAQLVTSSPAAGERLDAPPDQMVLVFSEPLEDAFTSVDIFDSDGEPVASNLGRVDPTNRFQLIADLPSLEDGVYLVGWQSLSAADGHTASGFFNFGVGQAGTVPTGSSGHGGFEPDVLATLGRWIGYLGLLAGFGLPLVTVVVLRQLPHGRVVQVASALMLLSALAALLLALRSATEVEGGNIAAYLFASRNGTLQVGRVTVLLAGGAAAIAVSRGRPRIALWSMGLASLTGIGLLAAAGHASALPGIAAMASQIVHVGAAGVWLTGVVVLAVIGWRPELVTRQREPLVRCVPRFSAIALVSIGLVGVTGFFASWSQTGELLALGSDYGRVLLVKLLLAAVALGLGGLNLMFGDRLGRLLTMRRRVAAEVVMGLAVLLATGLLSTTSPTDEARGTAIQPVPNAFGVVLRGMSLELLPGRPGVNQVAVLAEGAMGTATMDLVLDRLDTGGQTRIPLRYVSGGMVMPMPGMSDMPGMVHGEGDEASGPARFVADAVVLPPGSRWDANVQLLTERGGRELTRQRFSFEMGESGLARGEAHNVLDIGLVIAGLLAVGGALSVGLGLGGMRLPRCDAVASRLALAGGGVTAVVLGAIIGLGQLLPAA